MESQAEPVHFASGQAVFLLHEHSSCAAGDELRKARQGVLRQRVMDELQFIVAFACVMLFVPLIGLIGTVIQTSIPKCFGTWERTVNTIKCGPLTPLPTCRLDHVSLEGALPAELPAVAASLLDCNCA